MSDLKRNGRARLFTTESGHFTMASLLAMALYAQTGACFLMVMIGSVADRSASTVGVYSYGLAGIAFMFMGMLLHTAHLRAVRTES